VLITCESEGGMFVEGGGWAVRLKMIGGTSLGCIFYLC